LALERDLERVLLAERFGARLEARARPRLEDARLLRRAPPVLAADPATIFASKRMECTRVYPPARPEKELSAADSAPLRHSPRRTHRTPAAGGA